VIDRIRNMGTEKGLPLVPLIRGARGTVRMGGDGIRNESVGHIRGK
jgi:hypothetical protein